jgi:hypothetical protein
MEVIDHLSSSGQIILLCFVGYVSKITDELKRKEKGKQPIN